MVVQPSGILTTPINFYYLQSPQEPSLTTMTFQTYLSALAMTLASFLSTFGCALPDPMDLGTST